VINKYSYIYKDSASSADSFWQFAQEVLGLNGPGQFRLAKTCNTPLQLAVMMQNQHVLTQYIVAHQAMSAACTMLVFAMARVGAAFD